MNKLIDKIVCNIIRAEFLFSTEKWVTIWLSRWKFFRYFLETCNVVTKLDVKKCKIVLEYVQFCGIITLLFCEIIVR